MKQLILTILVMLLVACGADITDPKAGYFEDNDNTNTLINNGTIINTNETNSDSKNSARAELINQQYLTDTVLIADTVYYPDTVTFMDTMVITTVFIDTVDNIIHDTIHITIIDTVLNTVIDTIVSIKVDTVINTRIDTVYTEASIPVNDPVEIKEIDTSIPRDTTISLYDTTDGTITMKTYTGVVYKDVFYEAKAYQYGMIAPPRSSSYSPRLTIPDNYVEVGDYAWEMHCSGSCGIAGTVHLTYLCGAITKPDYRDLAWRNDSQIKKFPGWRIFDERDAYDMAQYLNMLVSDTAQIFLSVLDYSQNGTGSLTAVIAKYKVPNTTSKATDKEKLKYICAYDLPSTSGEKH